MKSLFQRMRDVLNGEGWPRPRPRPIPTYAKADGPPDDWMGLEVLLDGVVVYDVFEVDTKQGWAIRYAHDEERRPVVANGRFVKERVEGAFELRWRVKP